MPHHHRTLHDYWHELETQVWQSGGVLRQDYVKFWFPPGEQEADPSIMLIERHHLDFPDGSCLEFRLTINRDMVLVEYNFDYRDREKRLIFRKDKQPGYERLLGMDTHIHANPRDEDDRAPYPEVDFSEVMGEVWRYLETGDPGLRI